MISTDSVIQKGTYKMPRRLIPAAGYIRMSTDRQDESPKQQKPAIIRLANQHGYKIVAWYRDEGITGDSFEERPEFCRMLNDAQAGKFMAILCWDQDRFSRADMFDVGEVVQPLRKHGVSLVTVTDGVVNWDDFEGQLLYLVKQGGKNKFLHDLSKNVTRGMLSAVGKGRSITSAPLGMMRVFYDEAGNRVAIERHGERKKTPKSWRVTLTASDQEDEVQAVRWAFKEFAETDCRYIDIARGLTARGYRTEAGKPLSMSRARKLLGDKKYIGTLEVGRWVKAKYYTIDEDGNPVRASDVNRSATGEREPLQIIENNHEAIIDRALFDRVQAKMKNRHRGKRPSDNTYVLNGIVHCSCGRRMAVNTIYEEDEVRTIRRYYFCKQCSYRIRKDEIEPFIMGIAAGVLKDNRERVRQLIGELTHQRAKGNTGPLERRLVDLEEKIARGRRNLLEAHPDDVPAMREMLDELRADRDNIQAELSLTTGPARDLKDMQAAALRKLDDLAETFSASDEHDRLREANRQLFDRITLRFTKRGRKSVFLDGTVELGNDSFSIAHSTPVRPYWGR